MFLGLFGANEAGLGRWCAHAGSAAGRWAARIGAGCGVLPLWHTHLGHFVREHALVLDH